VSAGRHVGGFTLIELVACIVIMAVLAAIAGPRFFENQAFTDRGYAAEVVAALRAARQVAAASSCPVRVTIDPVTGYQAMQRALDATGECTGAWTVLVRLTDGNPLAGAPPAGSTIAPATQIEFSPTGQLNGGAPPPLVVGPFTIRVDAVSGFVSI
jgi:MSHA pilin protein MshC